MNQFCFAGKVAALPTLYTAPQGWKTGTVLLDVQRPFANGRGEFESDLLPVEVWRGSAETLAHCVKIGSWITVRGRVASRMVDSGNGTEIPVLSLVAEKVEYLH